MPILTIEIVGEPTEVNRDLLAQTIADASAEVFDAGPSSVWVRIHVLPFREYAENQALTEVRPVFVSVLKRSLPAPAARQREAGALAVAIANACNRPQENVHILYEPAGAGRIAFGGILATE